MGRFVETLNSTAGPWAEAMVAALWQSTALAGAVLLISVCFKGGAPAIRYWLWMFVALRLLVMPFVTMELALLPAPLPAQEISGSISPPPSRFHTEAAHAESQAAFRSVGYGKQASDSTSPPSSSLSTPPFVTPQAALSLKGFLMILWCAGIAIAFARLAWACLNTRRIIARARFGDRRIDPLAVRAGAYFGMAAPPRVGITSEPVSPFVYGAWRPVVILPYDLVAQASDEQLMVVLAHEFAHVRRRDPLLGWVFALTHALYFFHPVLPLVKRQLLLERERACDNWVLAVSNARPSTYARVLVSVAALCSAPRHAVPLLVTGETFYDLNRRLNGLRRGSVRRARIAPLTGLVLAIIGLICAPGIVLSQQAADTQGGAPTGSHEVPAPATTQTATISGLVTDEAMKPIAGAVVEWGLVDEGPENRLRTRTTAEGRYRLDVPGSGSGYRLGVAAEGYAPAWNDYLPPWSHVPIENRLDARPPREVDFTLVPPHSLEGEVLDEEGLPVPDVAVNVRTAEAGSYSSISSPAWRTSFPGDGDFDTVTDQNGRFKFHGLPVGDVSIDLTAPHRHLNTGNYPVDEFRTLTMSWSGRAGSIQGQVADAQSGKPVTAFTVARRHIAEQRDITDSNGRFEWVDSVTEGRDYSVHIYARGYAPVKESIKAAPLGSEDWPTIALSPKEPLRVRLVDAQSKAPVRNAETIHGILGDNRYFMWAEFDRYIDGYHGLDMVQRGAPDDTGEMWFCENEDQPGTLFILVPGYERLILKPEARGVADASGAVTVSLRPEARIKGVLKSDGVGRSGVQIGLYKVQGDEKPEEEFEYATTDSSGAFSFDRLGLGEYQVTEGRSIDKWLVTYVPVTKFSLHPGEEENLGEVSSPAEAPAAMDAPPVAASAVAPAEKPIASAPAPKTRTLRFPPDRVVGMLHLKDRSIEHYIDRYWYWNDDVEWIPAGPAVGTITVPEDKLVYLVLNQEGARDTSFLKNLDPDDIYRLASPYGEEGDANLDDRGLENIVALRGLRHLELRYSHVTDTGLALLQGLPHLERLDVPRSTTDAGLAHISQVSTLQGLYFHENQVSDVGLAHLAKLRELQEIELGSGTISDAGLEHLASLPKLGYVKLWGYNFSDAAMEHIARIPNLTNLNVSNLKLTNRGVQSIAKSPKLETLDLYGVKDITGIALKYLAEMKTLRRLGLSCPPGEETRLNSQSMSYLAESTSLEALDAPRSLDDSGLLHLAKLRGLRELNTWGSSGDKNITDKGLVAVTSLASLHTLSIAGGGITDTGLTAIGSLSNLEFLSIMTDSKQVTNIGVGELANLKKLKNLSLNLNRKSGVTLAALTRLNSLTALTDLTVYGINQDDSVLDLSPMVALEKVSLNVEGGMRDEDVACFSGMSKLQWLGELSGISDAGVAHIAGLTQLVRLYIKGEALTDAALLQLKGMNALDSLGVTGDFTDAGLQELHALKGLHWLTVNSATPLSDAAQERLVASLPNLTLYNQQSLMGAGS